MGTAWRHGSQQNLKWHTRIQNSRKNPPLSRLKCETSSVTWMELLEILQTFICLMNKLEDLRERWLVTFSCHSPEIEGSLERKVLYQEGAAFPPNNFKISLLHASWSHANLPAPISTWKYPVSILAVTITSPEYSIILPQSIQEHIYSATVWICVLNGPSELNMLQGILIAANAADGIELNVVKSKMGQI